MQKVYAKLRTTGEVGTVMYIRGGIVCIKVNNQLLHIPQNNVSILPSPPEKTSSLVSKVDVTDKFTIEEEIVTVEDKPVEDKPVEIEDVQVVEEENILVTEERQNEEVVEVKEGKPKKRRS